MEHLDLPLLEPNNSGGDLLSGLSVSSYSQFYSQFLSLFFFAGFMVLNLLIP